MFKMSEKILEDHAAEVNDLVKIKSSKFQVQSSKPRALISPFLIPTSHIWLQKRAHVFAPLQVNSGLRLPLVSADTRHLAPDTIVMPVRLFVGDVGQEDEATNFF
jgi:hypothetical protein